jgi:HTH-type transcriptional regulator/antitoxin HigA
MEVMPVRARRKPIDPEKYARLVAVSLPIPPRTVADNERLIEILSVLDEREDLTSEEGAFAELLAIVIEDFEDKHYALPAVPPHEALKALMEDRGLRHKDVWPVVGNKGLTTEILNGRRKISSALAKRLAAHLRVPVELFV